MNSNIPKIVKMEVFPVAGYDSMLLNLSGAHGPYFTRNIVIMTDDIRKIKEERLIKGHNNFKVYVDSPLAIEATHIYEKNIFGYFDKVPIA